MRKFIVIAFFSFSHNIFAGINDQLQSAVSEGKIDKVKAALQKKANVNAKDSDGNSPLVLAATYGHFDIVKLLIEAKADVGASEGKRALTLISETNQRVQRLIDAPMEKEELARYIEGRKNIISMLITAGVEDTRTANELLLAEAALGDLGGVQNALQKNADANAGDSDGRTALMFAARSGNEQLVKTLLKAKADVHAVEKKEKFTALITASCHAGRAKIVELLIDADANVNAVAKDGFTALLYALMKPDRDIAKMLLKAKADAGAKGVVYVHGAFRLTAYGIAAERKDQEMLDLFNARKTYWPDRLVDAAERNDFEGVKQALKYGYKANSVSSEGFTALTLATAHNNTEMIALLKDEGAVSSEKLLDAIEKNDAAAVKQALKEGVNPSAIDPQRGPPMLAAMQKPEILKLLIKAGADVNAKDREGAPYLWSAAANGDVELVQLLIGAKANVNAVDRDDTTALMIAWAKGHTGVAGLLRGAGAAEANLQTKLYFAVRGGYLPGVESAVAEGADLEAKGEDGDGCPALVEAQRVLKRDILKYLLTAKTDKNAQCADGFTAVMHAAQSNDLDGIKVLIRAKVNINIKIPNDTSRQDLRGKTALWIAKNNQNWQIVRALQAAGAK